MRPNWLFCLTTASHVNVRRYTCVCMQASVPQSRVYPLQINICILKAAAPMMSLILSFYRAAHAVWIKPWFGDLT